MQLDKKTTIGIIAGFVLCFVLFFAGYTVLYKDDDPVSPPVAESAVTVPPPTVPATVLPTVPATAAVPPVTAALTVTAEPAAPESTFPEVTFPEVVTATVPATEKQTVPRTETTVPSAEVIDQSTQDTLKQILNTAGYGYDADNNIFYAQENAWQKAFGYSKLYDLFASFGQMIFDTVRFKFNFGEKSWMFQIWKGRYGATTGCEVGIYKKNKEYADVDYWEGVGPEDYMGIEVNMYRYDKFYFHRGPEKHWWLTAFRLGDIVYSDGLNMQVMFELPDKIMTNRFEKSVMEQMNERDDLRYIRNGDTKLTVYWGNLITDIFPELS